MFGGAKAVLYKAKRGKYMEVSVESVDQASMVLVDALGGGGSWMKTEKGIKFAPSNAHDEL